MVNINEMSNYGIKLSTGDLIPSANNIISGIYLIQNNLTNQLYVGQSVDIVRRWHEHCNYSKFETRIDRAIKKYMPENFSIYLLMKIPAIKELLDKYEQFYISFFGTFDNNTFHYNMTLGGEGFSTGENHPMYKGKIIDESGGINYLKKLKASGKSLEDILDEFGMSDKAFYNYLKNHGYGGWHELTGKKESTLGMNHHNFKQQIIIDNGGIEFLKSCKSKGLSKHEVSDNIGVSIFVIDNFLKHNNTNWEKLTGIRESSRGKNHPDCKWQIIDDAGGIDYIIKAEASERTLEDLLNEFGIGHKSFYRYLNDHGYSGWYDLSKKRKFKIIDDAGGIQYLKQSKQLSKSMKTVLKELNVSERLLNKYLKSHNYTNWSKLE